MGSFIKKKVARTLGGKYMAKMGRPAVENPKKHMVGLKMTDDEIERLKTYAAKKGKTVSEVLQDAINLQYEADKKK